MLVLEKEGNIMQKKILVIGSTVVDVHIFVDHLPTLEEDINPKGQKMMLGGCAYNVADMIRLWKEPYTLFSPVGTGIYGEYIEKELTKRNIPISLTSDAENGCCYCLIDKHGQRTFLSVHGTEYKFESKNFEKLDMNQYDMIYVCGLEVEELTGENIISFLEDNQDKYICYAPGPRLLHIDLKKNQKMMSLANLIHLNQTEAKSYLEKLGVETTHSRDVAEKIYETLKTTSVITNGDQAVFLCEDDTVKMIDVKAVEQVNGTGAGDGHIGTILALLHKGFSLEESIRYANEVSARIVQTNASTLPEEKLPTLHKS